MFVTRTVLFEKNCQNITSRDFYNHLKIAMQNGTCDRVVLTYLNTLINKASFHRKKFLSNYEKSEILEECIYVVNELDFRFVNEPAHNKIHKRARAEYYYFIKSKINDVR